MVETKKIAIYGKGGIGKSTIVSNIAAAYSENKNVLVIGCDPKADTTRTLYGKRIPTILNVLKNDKNPGVDSIVFDGFNGISCIESGGPEPGVGCAGRGVIVAMNLLEKLDVFSDNLDVIIYDVLGDVVCGGFSVPLRDKYADEVYIVTSGEYMSLYAANNISKGIRKLNGNLGGVICNCKDVVGEKNIVSSFARKINSSVIGTISRDNLVHKSELEAKTVIERFSNSKQAKSYRQLADNILGNNNFCIPEPMVDADFEDFLQNLI